ncbi:hypothetical protein EVAR_63813_1 [Eumeta japonica]|uniref:Uncharacterized protein n=1 Tax=Eumeta variegata TaxID=151549 RepID=A0A4C2A3F1_EUMVA|nr:hypothetical protein EVAR_63813_1 [Eumeta japonica]
MSNALGDGNVCGGVVRRRDVEARAHSGLKARRSDNLIAAGSARPNKRPSIQAVFRKQANKYLQYYNTKLETARKLVVSSGYGSCAGKVRPTICTSDRTKVWWIRRKHENEPTGPVRYHILTDYRRDITVSTSAVRAMSQNSGGPLPYLSLHSPLSISPQSDILPRD